MLWRWSDRIHIINSFSISNARRCNLLPNQEVDFTRLNRIWHSSTTNKGWHDIWSLIWSSDLSLKAKTFLWRVFARGLFLGTRALKIGMSNGDCLLCSPSRESIPHIYFECSHAQRSWQLSAGCFGGVLSWPWTEAPTDLQSLLWEESQVLHV